VIYANYKSYHSIISILSTYTYYQYMIIYNYIFCSDSKFQFGYLAATQSAGSIID